MQPIVRGRHQAKTHASALCHGGSRKHARHHKSQSHCVFFCRTQMTLSLTDVVSIVFSVDETMHAACIVRLMCASHILYEALSADTSIWQTVASRMGLKQYSKFTWAHLSKKMQTSSTRCYECCGANGNGRPCISSNRLCIFLCTHCASDDTNPFRRLVTRREMETRFADVAGFRKRIVGHLCVVARRCRALPQAADLFWLHQVRSVYEARKK